MDYTLTAPSPASGLIRNASGNFTVTLGVGDPGGTVVITPAASAGSGTFSPTTVSLTNGSRSATFTFTPTTVGARTITVTNNGALTDPAGVTYTCTAQPTHLQTVIKNKSGATLNLSFLPPHGRTLANNATLAFYGDIDSLLRVRWQDRDVQDFYRALTTGKIEVLSSPAALIKDTASGAVKAVTAASGTLGVANPTWGAYTDS